MRIILDCRALDLYKGWSAPEAFHGGTETYVKVLARGLAGLGHTMHVVSDEVSRDVQIGEREFWWPLSVHPTRADCIIAVHNLECLLQDDYEAELLVLATNGIDPNLYDLAETVDAFPVFSETHADLLSKARGIDREKCFVTGLGVSVYDYSPGEGKYDSPWLSTADIKVPGRIFVGNDPQRGLWHMLDIFDKLKVLVPHATLHVGYDFDRVFEAMRWQASAVAEMLWDCLERLALTDGVTSLGALDRKDLIREQLECQVHVWPSDPPNTGSQIHGLTQMECAAAGAGLVLSDIEAFPEIFGAAATLLPVPGTYDSRAERRVDAQDWAEVIAELMLDENKWTIASQTARALAERHTWDGVVGSWEAMFAVLVQKVAAAA